MRSSNDFKIVMLEDHFEGFEHGLRVIHEQDPWLDRQFIVDSNGIRWFFS
jgi:hypothetical protein